MLTDQKIANLSRETETLIRYGEAHAWREKKPSNSPGNCTALVYSELLNLSQWQRGKWLAIN